jgi:transcription antitermination factor NusG
MEGFGVFFCFFPRLLSYLVCSVIGLNDLMDDYHFSNITKLNPEKKTLEGRGTVQPRPNSSIISIYLDCEQKKKEKKNLGQKLVLVKLITNNETSNSVKSLSQISHKKKSRL